ncbi:N-acetylmuramoyl-L-alanine amidase [Enterococcus gilvus]|uniref:peptidoglycan recognition protein family protein n=1 Tax=Enterococcus gilvus TaxID=160453 RepID=UPI003D6AE75C
MQLMSGIAGSRGRNPYGVVIHNDAASEGATTTFYRNWLPSHNAELGFAHWYVCSDGILQVENEANMAWHTANANGNANYIGIEACQSMGNLDTFRNNEDRSVKLAAEILKRYGLQPNRNTVILHKQFSATACPHRSVSVHGDWTIMQDYFIAQIQKYMNGSTPNPAPKPQPSGNKNGIAIDNVSKDQAVKMVQRIQTKYAWTLLRDQVKRVLQPNKVYTLVITCDSKWKYENAVNRLKQELKTYYPGYMQQNIAIVDGDKPIIKIEARNLNDEQSKKMEGHMRNFLKDILLDGQTYAEANSYGTYDVRIKGEGFNDHDAPIVLKEIQEMGKAKDVGINPAHIKGFQY